MAKVNILDNTTESFGSSLLPQSSGYLGTPSLFFLRMPPSLPLPPDPRPQTPVLPVSVIGAVFAKFESALNHGSITQARSPVDLPEGCVAFELSMGAEASSTPTLTPTAWEALRLAGG